MWKKYPKLWQQSFRYLDLKNWQRDKISHKPVSLARKLSRRPLMTRLLHSSPVRLSQLRHWILCWCSTTPYWFVSFLEQFIHLFMSCHVWVIMFWKFFNHQGMAAPIHSSYSTSKRPSRPEWPTWTQPFYRWHTLGFPQWRPRILVWHGPSY